MVSPPISPAPRLVAVGRVRPAASEYAVIMSLMATVSNVGSVIRHGSGPAASTEYVLPVTSAQVRALAAPVIGLAPTFPVITGGGTSVTPDLVKTAKEDAELRFTGAGPCPFGFAG